MDKSTIYELERPIKPEWPLWVHILLRLGLQSVVGYMAWHFWMFDQKFLSVICGIVFVYLIVVVVFGEKLRSGVLKIQNM